MKWGRVGFQFFISHPVSVRNFCNSMQIGIGSLINLTKPQSLCKCLIISIDKKGGKELRNLHLCGYFGLWMRRSSHPLCFAHFLLHFWQCYSRSPQWVVFNTHAFVCSKQGGFYIPFPRYNMIHGCLSFIFCFEFSMKRFQFFIQPSLSE